MKCRECGGETIVAFTRKANTKDVVLRKRICLGCGKMFKVYEFIGRIPPPRKKRVYHPKNPVMPKAPVEKPKTAPGPDMTQINIQGLLARAGRYKGLDREERKE